MGWNLDYSDRIFLIQVNNAGVLETGSIENTSLAQFDRVMGINVRSIYQLTTLLVPQLKKTNGCIVNVSSVNGIRSVSFNLIESRFEIINL